MYSVTKSIDIDFAHHVDGHLGPCINIHGHTWKFEVKVSSDDLDEHGFVIDFSDLKREILAPIHQLLDHGLLLSRATFDDVEESLLEVCESLFSTRCGAGGSNRWFAPGELCGMVQHNVGGLKVITSPFAPTSERLAKWLWTVASDFFPTSMAIVARVYETLHPVEAVAEYTNP